MPRSARAIVTGGCYHLLNRGNNRATIFPSERDYGAFFDLIAEAQERHRLELFAACLMPNHFHLVARVPVGTAAGRWMHWLLTTHSHRFHQNRGTTGRVWQGRFKAFPIEQDAHLLAVMRYVERNPLRAGLVARARHWAWGSLAWRFGGDFHELLSPPPVPLPSEWERFVEAAQTPAELAAIRDCVNRQRPYGSRDWITEATATLGLHSSVRRPGRPRKDPSHAKSAQGDMLD